MLRHTVASHPPVDSTALFDQLVRELRETAKSVTPQFFSQMPGAYFRDTDPATVRAHLSAIVAARASNIPPQLILKDDAQDTWTFVHEQSYRGLLSGLVEQLPRDRPLASAKVHTAADGGLVLDVFRFGATPRFDGGDPQQGAKLEETVAHARSLGVDDDAEALPTYLAQCSADFVRAASPSRILETWRLTRQVIDTQTVACALHPQKDPDLKRISVVTSGAQTRVLFERIVRHLGRMNFDITRAYLDVLRSHGEAPITSLGFVVRDPDRRLVEPSASTWRSLERAIKRLRWLDEHVLQRLEVRPQLGLLRAEILVALTRLVHPVLAAVNPFAYTRDRLVTVLDRYPEHARAVADGFLARFLPDGQTDDLSTDWAGHIEGDVEDDTERRFLATLGAALPHILRSNVHVSDRLGLAMEVDPAFFDREGRERPYGAYFVHADRTDAFHVRFRDIARGGVRAVRPRGPEQYVRESERLLDEVYDLAFAQQLKNKDIPEGGSKAVVLIAPDASYEAGFKAFIDGILDLLCAPDARARLYLGPDENITPEMIEWTVARAAARGYPEPDAFMSSKPGAGVNHKAFGVTSEGINVFVEEALKAVGIDPRQQAFTVKMTGGPDGDVAGNQLRIMAREFGDRATVVGIADGSGAGWDPDGLDMQELLRLVANEHAIAAFDRTKLSPRGSVIDLTHEEGLRRRNALPFDVVSDVFITGGGRPNTIHADNWHRFLHDGVPSSRVIVEGANLFVSPEARQRLSESGVVVVKDSAANKCGVICSSYEVAASLLLAPEAFLAIKPRFVEEVLVLLRQLARQEAVRLFRDHAENPSVPLPDRCIALSRGILRASDAVARALPDLPADQQEDLLKDVRAHLPASLVEAAGDRLEALPEAYRHQIVAARLGAALVYAEGLGFIDAVPDDRLAARCIAYHQSRVEAARLADDIARSGAPNAARAAALLLHGGARAALNLREQAL